MFSRLPSRLVRERPVHTIQNAVKIRKVVLFQARLRIRRVVGGNTDDGRLQVVETLLCDTCGDLRSGAAGEGRLVGDHQATCAPHRVEHGLQLGAAPEDVIGILAELGRDTAGALSIGKPGTTSTADWRPIPSDKALEKVLAELPSKPFLVGEDGVSMSLAGVQTKLGVAIDAKDRICVPINGAPSTWILKPDAERLFGGVQNEALCLVLAKRLPPANTFGV